MDVRRIGAVVTAVLLLAGCDPAPVVSAPSPAPVSGPTRSWAPNPPPVVRAAVASGPVALRLTLPEGSAEPAVVPGQDETVLVTLTMGRTPVGLVPTSGGLVGNVDGSVTVLDESGTVVGGLAAPSSTGGSVRLSVGDDQHAELTVTGLDDGTGEPSPTVAVELSLGSVGVRSATWGVHDGGRSLAVDATPWARGSGVAGTDTAWAQLVAAVPEADTASMRDQFLCHALGAPDKRTWNLEPWRPDVGLVAVVAARCNPG